MSEKLFHQERKHKRKGGKLKNEIANKLCIATEGIFTNSFWSHFQIKDYDYTPDKISSKVGIN